MDENIELDASGQPTKAWLERMYIEKQLTYKQIAALARTVTKTDAPRICNLMKRYGISARKPIPVASKEALEQMYVNENLSTQEIADRLGLKLKQVSYLLHTAYGIPAKQPKPRKEVHPTREWLMQKHFEEGVSWKDIREMLGYGDGTFHELLKKYDIPRKQYVPVEEIVSKEVLYQLHVVEGLTAVRIAARYGCNHSRISTLIKRYDLDPQRQLVNHHRIPPIAKEELERVYINEQMTWPAMAERYGVSAATVKRWMDDYSIPRRSPRTEGYAHKNTRTRSAIPATRFGREFSAQEREKILERDGYRCQMPGCNCTEKWKLEVHHIIPVEHKGNNALENGITLCRPCHISIKHKELQYVALFQYILKNTLLGAQIGYIGETPAVDNPDGSLVS